MSGALSQAQFGSTSETQSTSPYPALKQASDEAAAYVDRQYRGMQPRFGAPTSAPQQTVHNLNPDGTITSRLEGGF